MAVRRADMDEALVRVCDLAGRPRGTGFLADLGGTLLTSHEAVDGLPRLVLHGWGDQVHLAEKDAITPLPELGLALVATEGLTVAPMPVAITGPAHPDRQVRLQVRTWTDAAILGTASVTYTATDRFHLLEEVYELGLDTPEPLRLDPHVSGTPVLDAETGAVLAVVVTALQAGHSAAGFAVPLRPHDGPLAELLARNAATVPAYGPHLNLAGALQLTGTSVGSATGPREWHEPVVRPETAGEFRAFLGATGEAGPLVLGLVGDPGSGRTTELAQLAAQRAQGAEPAPTVWLRGAELRPEDGGLKDAVERSLRTAGRIVAAAAAGGTGNGGSGGGGGSGKGNGNAGGGDAGAEAPVASPDAVADLARATGRPLLVLLDTPEEMPPVLAHALPDWTAGTASWLRAGGVRLVVACRPEYWERAGALFPAGMLYRPQDRPVLPPGAPARALPDCVRLGDLPPGPAARVRANYGIPDGALAEEDAAHPLALRLLSEVRAALPEEPEEPEETRTAPSGRAAEHAPETSDATEASDASGASDASDRQEVREADPPRREDIFSAYLDLVCLRIAVRLVAAAAVRERKDTPDGAGAVPPVRGSDVRRQAARVAGQVHEAARRCLGPGQGELDRESFESLFPWRTGWASAVLTEGLLVPAGSGYRFAHEEFADWLQGLHLDLDEALDALVHRWFPMPGVPAAPTGPAEAPVRLPARPAARAGHAPGSHSVPPAPPVAPPVPPRTLPVPRHRIGPVVQSLLLTARRSGPAALARRLEDLVRALDRHAAVPTRVVPEGAGVIPAPRPAREGGGTAAERVTGTVGECGPPAETEARRADAQWWASHLLGEVLLRVPDTAPYRAVLRLLAERITVRSVEQGGFAVQGLGGLADFGPWFWQRLELPLADRLDLLRLLLPADGPSSQGEGEAGRFLAAVGELLCSEPREVLPVVCGWFDDDRPMRTEEGGTGGEGGRRPTVATAAQGLLHTHRHHAVDDLAEALVEAAHPCADELLATLAEDEPSALCRAIDRWAHDTRPSRHVAAAAYGVRAARFVRSDADRELLRYSALAMLARPSDCTLHGAALALLVRDPVTRSRHLPTALAHFAAGDPQLTANALAAALVTHPEQVLAAFQARLREPGRGAAAVLRELAEVTTPALARRAAALVRDHLQHRPDGAAHVAEFLHRRLEQGPGVRAVLFPLVVGLLREHPPQVRRELVPVLADPGSHVSRPLRQELLDAALEEERDPDVLEAMLVAAAEGCTRRPPLLTRDLVHRVGLLLARSPEGVTLFDRRLVQLASAEPGFARQVRGWLEAEDSAWESLVGPGARRMFEELPAVPVP